MERRNTVQKGLVLSAVMEMHRHVTAEDVYTFIRRAHPAIGKGTVYRNLSILADESKIGRIEIPNGPDCYDYRTEKHYHVRCVKCGGLFDVDMDEINGIEALIHDKHGVLFLGYDILFRGICPDCQKGGTEEH